MTSEHYLQQACELAYSVARHDAETDPSFEPPQPMRSFLYVTKLPRRAITLAQQVIEEDADFRQRVASQATEDNVGKVGILWLYRPAGWASDFDDLTSDNGSEPEIESTTDFSDFDPTMASSTSEFDADSLDAVSSDPTISDSAGSEYSLASSSDASEGLDLSDEDEGGSTDQASSAGAFAPVVSIESADKSGEADAYRSIGSNAAIDPPLVSTGNDPNYLGNVAVSEQPYFPEPETDLSSFSDADGELREATEVDYESDAFESELSSLRGLVNRLKDEREQVVTATDDGQSAEFGGMVGLDDASGLRSDLESARHELSLAQTEASIARQEREEAQRQQSEALKRQVDLEKELSVTRQELYNLDQSVAESQTEIIGLQDQLKRAGAVAADGDRSKNVLQSQLDSMTAERAQLREERSELKTERDDLLLRIADVEAKTGGIDVGELTASNRSLTTELEQVTRDLARSTTQIQSLDERLKAASEDADTFKSEKIDLSSRLADAELNLETKTTQYDAARADNEKLASSVGTLRAERDGLQTQLTELQSSLAEVLNEQAESRQVLENDRILKSEIRAERDALLARVNAFEQADEELATKLTSVSKERDDLIVERDEIMEERGRLRGEASAAASEREQYLERITALEATQGSLATEVQAERRQREELASRILEFDETSARDKAELARHVEERAELMEAIETLTEAQATATEVKLDRERLQSELAELKRRTGEDADRATQKITEMSDQMAASENERVAYQRDISELKAQLQSVKVDFGELSREAAQLRLAANTPPAGLRSAEPSVETPAQSDPEPAVVPTADEQSADQEEVAQHTAVEETAEEVAAEELVSPEDETVLDLAVAETAPNAESAEEAGNDINIFGASETSSDGASGNTPFPGAQADETVSELRFEPTMPISLDDVANAGSDQTVDPTWGPPSEEQVEDPWAEPSADDGSGASDDNKWNQPAAAAGVVGAIGLAGVTGIDEGASEPDELDAVGDLISQAVNRFDSDGTEIGSVDSGPESGEEEPRSIFALDNKSGAQAIPERAGNSEGGELRRRKIEIPSDIMDDEIAVAQYVVSSPDVVLLVDGDAVAKLGWPSLPVAQQRDALVTYLASLSNSSGAAPDVVFDGRVGDDDSVPASRAVRIRLSTPPTEPAAALDELVDAYPEQWPIALVTDDLSLTSQAMSRGATVLNNGQLLDLFIGE